MIVDEHPEDAIDRALRGELEPGERPSLDQHLAVCSACAAHLRHAPRFQAELAAPPRAELLERRAIEGAMASRRSTSARRRPVARWIMRSAAAGLLLLLGGGAVALIGRANRSPAPGPQPSTVPVPVSVPATAGRPPTAESPATDAEPAPPTAPTSTVSAAALFRRGGELRRQGRAAAAIGVYRQLQRNHPQTREAQLSFALAGQLLLDGGRSNEALSQFDR
jgi:anti-sigma factor RsiW